MAEAADPTAFRFILPLGKLLHRERHRRGRELGDHVDALGVVPAPRDGGGEIRLILFGDQLDFLAEHLAAEILDRHLRGFDRKFAAIVRVATGLIVQHADLHTPMPARPATGRAPWTAADKSRFHFVSLQFFIRKNRLIIFITSPAHLSRFSQWHFHSGAAASDPSS